MDSRPGTYALVLKTTSSLKADISRWGPFQIQPGYYIYIGSAFGPGGVLSRVSRHCREKKSKRWHIDYLREHASPVACWYSYNPERLEHVWADSLAGVSGFSAIDGFGCSDCRCRSHLFFAQDHPDLDDFLKQAGSDSHPIMSVVFE